MQNSQTLSYTCIKANDLRVVKPTFAGTWLKTLIKISILFSLFGVSAPLWSAENLSPNTTSNNSDDDIGPLPDIEAKTFPVKVIRRSSSNKIYLFEDSTERMPKVGHLLLLKREDEAFMAFRVLKTYPDRKAIAAKRIRRYRGHRILENDAPFLAIEKISDVNYSNSSQDNSDLAELEGKLNILPFDPELDAGTPAPPPEPEEEANLSIEETQPIDHNLQWLTVGFGYLRNNAATGGSYFFSAVNVRYAVTLARLVFFNQKHLQDSIAVEGGIYFYKTLNYVIQGDAYSSLAMAGSVRYNLLFGESFGVFAYLGLSRNSVLASSQAQDAGINALTSILPLGGLGFLFQIGPNWYTRVDMGIDTIGLNLVLRF